MPAIPRYLSTAQAGERLGLSREHVRRLIQRGELRAEETVNGFMLDASEVDQYAIQRRILRDQRQFRAAVDDLAIQARRVDEATGIQNAVARVRDQMKQYPAFEVPAVVAPHLRWIEREVAAQKTLATLIGPTETIMERWRRYDEDARRAVEHAVRGVAASEEMRQVVNMDTTPAMPTWQEWARSDRPEDVLAKLDAVREEVTGGKRMPDNSTDIIRAKREARGQEM